MLAFAFCGGMVAGACFGMLITAVLVASRDDHADHDFK